MTELLWDSRYYKDGRKTAPLRVALPFQTVEAVNESAAHLLRTRNLFAEGKPSKWRNRSITCHPLQVWTHPTPDLSVGGLSTLRYRAVSLRYCRTV